MGTTALDDRRRAWTRRGSVADRGLFIAWRALPPRAPHPFTFTALEELGAPRSRSWACCLLRLPIPLRSRRLDAVTPGSRERHVHAASRTPYSQAMENESLGGAGGHL